ncbi:MAG: squalene/phytoene synthase family protein [Proteobacteria bacterium]|nr:squalene/phytoene synthase family protein [Pseudomonadota bacterium]
MIAAAIEPFAAATPPGSPRYFAWLYARPEQRPMVELTFALEYELSASVRSGIDHAVAHARLDWWQAEAEQLIAGAARHPLTESLCTARLQQGLGQPDLRALVATLRWDLAAATLPSQQAADHHAQAWSLAIFEPVVESLRQQAQLNGGADGTARDAVRHFAATAGQALGLERASRRVCGSGSSEGNAALTMSTIQPSTLMRDARAQLHTAVASLPREQQATLASVLVWLGCSYDALARQPDQPVATPWSMLRANLRAWRFARRACRQAFQLPPLMSRDLL